MKIRKENNMKIRKENNRKLSSLLTILITKWTQRCVDLWNNLGFSL